jgi:hypothetical protein
MAHDQQAPHHPRFKIKIDREQYEVDQEEMTGAELRQVPPTPIPTDRDLYEVRPGQDDLLIADDDVVTIRNGLRFFTAPGQINPGRR